jgi:transcriptional regulator with XRE-family HTH domain
MGTTASVASDMRSRRIAVGLSQLELAERARCSWSTIRLFDRGYRPAHSETFARVMAVLEALETEASGEYRLRPGLGVSGYRGDTDAPEAA